MLHVVLLFHLREVEHGGDLLVLRGRGLLEGRHGFLRAFLSAVLLLDAGGSRATRGRWSYRWARADTQGVRSVATWRLGGAHTRCK